MGSPEFTSKEQRKQQVIDNLSFIRNRVISQYQSSKNELRQLAEKGWEGDPHLQEVYDEYYAEAGFTQEDFQDIVSKLDEIDGENNDDDWGGEESDEE